LGAKFILFCPDERSHPMICDKFSHDIVIHLVVIKSRHSKKSRRIAKGKGTKIQTKVSKILHRKLKNEQHEPR
jgi:hypothetical protein